PVMGSVDCLPRSKAHQGRAGLQRMTLTLSFRPLPFPPPGPAGKSGLTVQAEKGGTELSSKLKSSVRIQVSVAKEGMTRPTPADLTQLLIAWSDGDQSALEKLSPLVYS